MNSNMNINDNNCIYCSNNYLLKTRYLTLKKYVDQLNFFNIIDVNNLNTLSDSNRKNKHHIINKINDLNNNNTIVNDNKVINNTNKYEIDIEDKYECFLNFLEIYDNNKKLATEFVTKNKYIANGNSSNYLSIVLNDYDTSYVRNSLQNSDKESFVFDRNNYYTKQQFITKFNFTYPNACRIFAEVLKHVDGTIPAFSKDITGKIITRQTLVPKDAVEKYVKKYRRKHNYESSRIFFKN